MKTFVAATLLFGAISGAVFVANDWGEDGIFFGPVATVVCVHEVKPKIQVEEPEDDKAVKEPVVEKVCRYPIRNFRAPPHAAPEIDAGAGTAAIALLVSLMLIAFRKRS